MNKNKKRGVIYTCITNNYDNLINHTYNSPDWDYVCFSDAVLRNPDNSRWRIRKLKFDKLDSHRNQRWHKIFPYKILKKYTYSIYIDANIDIVGQQFFSKIDMLIKKDSKIAQPYHPERDCIYDEIEACIKLGKDDTDILNTYGDFIKSKGMPRRYGLNANGIIYRKHNEELVKDLMESWWREYIKSNSLRDQLSWPYVLWTKKYKPDTISMNVFDKTEELVRLRPHNPKKLIK